MKKLAPFFVKLSPTEPVEFAVPLKAGTIPVRHPEVARRRVPRFIRIQQTHILQCLERGFSPQPTLANVLADMFLPLSPLKLK